MVYSGLAIFVAGNLLLILTDCMKGVKGYRLKRWVIAFLAAGLVFAAMFVATYKLDVRDSITFTRIVMLFAGTFIGILLMNSRLIRLMSRVTGIKPHK